MALYSGPLLEGCTEEWVHQERAAREQSCLQALLKLGESALNTPDYAAAVRHFQKAAGLDPWSDAARRGWMEALAKQGDRNAALQVYREFLNILRSDPTAVPDEQTRALYERLRAAARQQSSAPAAVKVEGAATPRVSGYLPHSLTELVGREDERVEVAERLRRSRLVTLTGMGGIGKTRLALEVAREAAREYTDGVWLVGLEAITEGKRVARQIASTLGLKEEPGRTALQSLQQHLRAKRMLLVLDNCEHLLETSAHVVAHLLQECGGVRILATSREALGITGETVWPVPALAAPNLEHLPQGRATLLRVLMSYESVQLFVERAQAVQKTFALTSENAQFVAQICARLEGTPLALELAAARIKTLTVEQVTARLDNYLNLLTIGDRASQTRQQTLRATLDWSYALLNESEKMLLGRLSVFAGGWTLQAAEQVCSGMFIEPWQVLDLLASLLDKSLVVFTEQEREEGRRYRLLEMVRQYGAEKLAANSEMGWVKTQHRDYFLALAEAVEPELTGANQGVWLARLEADHANLEAALAWCREEEKGAKAGLQLAGALYRFWEMHGHYSEGRAYLSEALLRNGADERTNERARALNGAGVLGYYQGDHVSAQALQEESLAIFRELGNRQGAAWALNGLADVAAAQGNHDIARALYEESLSIFRELGNRQGTASLLHHLGRLVREQGDYEQARVWYEEGLTISRELSNQQNVAWSLHHLGNVAAAQGDHLTAWSLQEECRALFQELGNRQGAAWALIELGDVAVARGNNGQAQALYEESLSIFRDLGNRQGTASLLHHLGRLVREQGDYEQARAWYEESLTIYRELNNRQGAGWSLNGMGQVAFEQGNYGKSRLLHEEGLILLRELGDRRGVAESLEGLAAVRLAQAKTASAAQLWGMAAQLRETIRSPLLGNAREFYERQLERCRLILGENAFNAAWQSGRALSWKAAISDIVSEGSSESLL